MKRKNKIFEIITSDENLYRAIETVNRTHRWKRGHRPNKTTLWVETTIEERKDELRKIIENGFVPKKPRVSERWDASSRKMRTITEPVQWPDQYVHHALIQALEPVMMRGMDRYCCGSIRGRGARTARASIEKWLKKDPKGTKYELCADIRHFYESLPPETVMARMRRLIKDRRALDLIWRIIKDGITLGTYTSQWFANTVLQPLDALIRQSGLCKYYVRYMDNFTIFGPNKRKLQKLRALVLEWLNANGLDLKGDWQIFHVKKEPKKGDRLPDAVGYRYGRTYTLPRKRTFLRMKRGMARCRKKLERHGRIPPNMAMSLLSRLGALKHCNSTNLYKILHKDGKITKELKRAVRNYQKEVLPWSTYLELYMKAEGNMKTSKPSGRSTAALAASAM